MTESGSPPSRSELRNFGLITGGGFAAIFGVLLPILRHHGTPIWPWVLCVLLVSTGLLAPRILKPIHYVWTRFGETLGWVNSQIILSIIFYLLFVPVALIGALTGWDPMAKRADPSAKSYRVPSTEASRQGMERPF